MYLIDTDTIIYAMNGVKEVIGRFDEHAEDPKAISVITYGELLFGAMKSARHQENLARVRHIGDLFPVVDVTAVTMETFSSLKTELQSAGKPVDNFDLVIASTALTLSYRLVTNNERHFKNIPGLQIENWSAPRQH